MSGTNGRTATQDEVLEAVEMLSDAELLRLRQFGERLTYGTAYAGGEDILHEAIVAVIGMKRRWPIELPFLVFMHGAMKGIASNDRTSLRARTEVSAAELVGVDDSDADEFLAGLASKSDVAGIDELLVAEEDRQALLRDVEAVYAWFEDDEEITLILMAIEDGFIGKAIQETCDMSTTQYESGRKRMRRGVAKMLAERRKT